MRPKKMHCVSIFTAYKYEADHFKQIIQTHTVQNQPFPGRIKLPCTTVRNQKLNLHAVNCHYGCAQERDFTILPTGKVGETGKKNLH